MNILWIQPNHTLALTSIFDGSDPAKHAKLLQKRGDIQADWSLAAINVDWPETGWPHECHAWDGKKVIVDLARAQAVTSTRLEAESIPVFAILDTKSLKNIEAGKDNKKIVEEKKHLRNIVNSALTVTNLEELKALSIQSTKAN